VFDVTVRALAATAAEHEKTVRALDNATKHPSGFAVSNEIRAQLAHLFPADLLEDIELQRLQHFPRYLRAAQTRLARAIVDPRKDASKAAPFLPLWQAYLAKKETANDRQAIARLRYTLEELRVALFAPELKPLEPVTIESAARAIAAIR
jgi:ATP-dependent helicase HrpA